MPTFKWTFRADDAGASKAMRDFAASVKAAEASTDQASRKMTGDLDKVAGAAKRTQASGLGGGIRNVAEATLTSGVSPLTTLQSAALSQFGGAQQVLAGVGTAALVAGAGVAAAGVAVTKFGTDSVRAFSDAASAVDSFQDVTGGTARESSVFVAAAQQLGVSSDALGGSIAKMLKSVNANEGALREYGATVVRTSAGNVDAVGTFQSVAGAFAQLTDPAKRAELASLAFGKGWTSIIDVLERGGPELERFFQSASQHAPIFNEQDLADAVELKQHTSELSQEWERFKVNAGKKTVPLFTNLVANAADFIGWISGSNDALSEQEQRSNAAAQAMFDHYTPGVEQATSATSTFTSSLYSVADAYASAGNAWLTGLGSIGSQSAGILAADDYESALSSLDSTFEDAAAAQQDFADTSGRSAQQIGDAQRSVQDALDGVAEAQADYEKTVADSSRNVAEAQADYAKAAADAYELVADADEQSSKRIVDAQERVGDARRRAADVASSAARRLVDAEQAVRDASVAALRDDDPYAASRRREEAEQNLSRVKEDSAHDQQDAALDVSRSERDLADAHVQATRDRQDAEEQAAERIATAEQRIADANRSAAEQITQAQKRIVEANARVDDANMRLARTTDEAGAANTRAAAKVSAHRVTQQQYDQAVQKTIDATPGYIMSLAQRGVPLDEINAKLKTGADKLKDQGRQLGLNTQLADIYGQHADSAALKVLRMTAATYELYSLFQRESKRLGVDPGIIAGDAALLGLDFDQAVRRDSGGPLPPGLSMVLNQTGGTEWVLTPGQVNALAGSGGGGTTVVVQGSLITERELASILADMKRKGF